MKTLRAFGSFALVSSALAVVACSSDDPAARVDATKSAFAKPTGKVTAASAKLVITRSQAATDLNGVLAFASFNGKCGGDAGGTSGTLDLECASGGSTTGTADYSADVSVGASGASTLVSMTFNDACKDGVCINGSIAESTESGAGGSEVIVDADIDVTKKGAAAEHTHLGIKTSSGVSGSSAGVVIYDDDDKSFVLDASATAGSSSVSIKGANGSFSCSYESGGAKGSCSGSGSFSW